MTERRGKPIELSELEYAWSRDGDAAASAVRMIEHALRHRGQSLESLRPGHEQASLFDPVAADEAALKGMELARQAERVQAWKDAASAWLEAQSSELEFTADDLIAAIGVADEGANRNNVVGAWLNTQRRTGRIRFAGRLRKSERISRHGNLVRVWIIV